MITLNDQMSKLEELLIKNIQEFGFEKKRKRYFIRKTNQCTQHIALLETKVTGKDEIYISISVGFTYELVNKLISLLQDRKYNRIWATASTNLADLIDPRKLYGFYITTETDILAVAEDIGSKLKECALAFWDNYNTMEKYYSKLVDKDELARKSTYALKRPEWNILALSIILNYGNSDQILEEYQDDFLEYKFDLLATKNRIKTIDIERDGKKL